MPPDLHRLACSRLLDVELYNLYGPTEAAVDATWWACRRGDHRPSVPIGRPISNAQAYVLDVNGRPAAPGRAGRALHRRRGAGARLPQCPRTDGRALPTRPVHQRARRAALPDGRPLPMAGRRYDRVPRSARPPGENTRLPNRAWRGGDPRLLYHPSVHGRQWPSMRPTAVAILLVAYVVGGSRTASPADCRGRCDAT